MSGPSSLGNSSPVSVLTQGSSAPKKPQTLTTPRRFEFSAGGKLPIGDSFQLETTLAYVPHPRISLGVGLQTDVTHRWAGKAEVGLRFHPSNLVIVQPTLVVGVGKLSDLSISAGPLAEKAVLNGVYYFFNPELRIELEPFPKMGVGLFFSVGLNFEWREGANANPSQLVSKANPKAIGIAPTVGFGLYFGTKGKKANIKEEPPPAPPIKPNVVADKPASIPPAPSPPSTFNEKVERIDQEVKKVTEKMEKEKAERIRKTIGHLRDKIAQLANEVSSLNEGINRTNEMARIFEEVQDRLSTHKKEKLSPKDRIALKNQLDPLIQATQPFTYEKTTKGQIEILSGLSFATLQKRFGERILRQLKSLHKNLIDHAENEMAKVAVQAISNLTICLQQGPEAVRIGYFQKSVAEIEGGMKTVESIEMENNLSSHEDWKQLRNDLNSLQSEVTFMARQLEALKNLTALFDGPTHNFADQVNAPDRARKIMERGLQFLKELTQSERYAGVHLEKLMKQYSHYFGNLSHNLGDYFIFLHTPPRLKNLKERRRWFPAVRTAREVLCQVNPTHRMSLSPLEEPLRFKNSQKKLVKIEPPK